MAGGLFFNTAVKKRGKVLLVGWDAADWKIIQPLIDRGEMPALGGIVNGGVSGNLASINPMLSPMLWTSIATGKRPFKHGVHGFTEVHPTLGVTMTSNASRRCRALWQILNEQGLRTHVVGWFVTHPAEPLRGACVSDRFGMPAPDPGQPWPLAPGTVFPAALGETLAALRVRPEELDGNVLRWFVPRAAEVNQARDKRLYQLARTLGECFSVHNAATHLLEHEPWDFAAVYYRSIDWISHHFMEFHPPRMPGRFAREFEWYREVVGAAYRLHDAMLGRLLQLAGPGTTVLVVSDHGFYSDHRRPLATPDVPGGIGDWHRPNGILALRGAGLKADELIHGASLLDIAPTVLALYGLPAARDMDGRVLAEAFTEPPAPETVETWEPAAGDEPVPAPPVERSPEQEWSVVQQFFELGYLEDTGADQEAAARETGRENQWGLARAYLDAGQTAEALPLLEAVYEQWPERWDVVFALARCQMNLGLYAEALETADDLSGQRTVAANRVLLANIEYRRGDYDRCLEHLASAEAMLPTRADVQVQLGRTLAMLRQWERAEASFQRATELNAEEPRGYLGLAHCHLHARRFEPAAEAALQALGLRFNLPLGHFYLGLALARLGEDARAIQALETCLRYDPAWDAAHRFLATLHGRRSDGAEKARFHRRQVAGRAERRQSEIKWQEELRRGVAARARERAGAKAARRAQQEPVEPPLSVPDLSVETAAGPPEFLVVSGLPRSGTSLMMQMLAAGGLEPMRDDLRPPDESNPRGYFEWQEIKKLPKDPRVILKAHGRVTKIISALLPFLPRAARFRVIFMLRPPEETAASQEIMRHRLTGSDDAAKEQASVAALTTALGKHRRQILDLLRASENVELLEVDYPALLDDPLAVSARVAAFAGLDADRAPAMAAVVEPGLCHHRGDAVGR